MRTVICHYHIYKNSGTSFDTLLQQNFGERHICFDGPFPFFTIDQEQLSRIINRKANIIAFSSHQIQLPAPASLEFNVLPAIFIRHPLLRIQSIYKFKRQEDDGTATSENAKVMSFDDWVAHCFNDRQEFTHITNAQTRLVGTAYRQRPQMRRTPHMMIYDIHQAMRNLDNVKLLARTEFFNQDVTAFSQILAHYGIDFNVEEIDPQNVTSDSHHESIGVRVEKLSQLLSPENYKKLVAANEQDLLLFDYASQLIEKRIADTHE